MLSSMFTPVIYVLYHLFLILIGSISMDHGIPKAHQKLNAFSLVEAQEEI